jgi:PAS domain S-box-containing protein
LEVTGLTREQVVGKRIEQVLPETAHALVISKYKEAINENKTVFWEEISTYPTGERVGAVAVTPVRTAEGVCTHLVGIVHDLTETRRTKEALRESKARFRNMLENVPGVSVQGYGPDGTVHYWNKASETVYGYTKEEAIGKNLIDLIIPPEMKNAVRENIKHGAQTGEMPPPSELLLLHKDGFLIPVFSSHVAVKQVGREPEMFCMGINLTELKQAEERIEHLNNVLKAIQNVNHVIQEEKDRDTLLQKACDALRETRDYDAVWFGFLSDGKTFATVKSSGFNEDFTRFSEYVMGGDYPLCIKNALVHKEMLVIVDKSQECGDCPFKNACTSKATAIIHVEHADRFFGVLAISLADDVAADDEEKELLKEVAGDIGFALYDMEMEEARKQAEEELRILSSVVEQSTSSIAILDKQGIVEYVNPKVLEFYEISPEEVVGKNWQSWISMCSTLREKLPEMRNTVRERGTTWKGEVTDKSKRGEVIWKAATIFPIKDAKDEIVRIVYTSEDITERKKAEEALQESEERYRTIVESMHDLVFVIDKDNCITQYYATSEHLLYTSPDDFMGKHVKDVMPTDLSDEILKRLKEVRLTGHKGSLEYPLEIDGELFWFSSVLSLHDDGSSVVTVVRDITERKKTEEALRESEERYRSFVEKSNNYPGKICR